MMEEWVVRTFKKYHWAEYCVDCGTFVYNTAGHLKEGHAVLRRV